MSIFHRLNVGASALRHASRVALIATFVLGLLLAYTGQAYAMKIKSVTSPAGIKAWFVEEHSVPLMAMRFAFEGGSAQDPEGREGLANFLTGMLDEGAGDLPSSEFQERMEEIAMRMSFEDGRDRLYGSFETLTVNRDEAVKLLKLALTKPRFDQPAVERIRKQLQAGLAFAARDPNRTASKEWFRYAFPTHAYGRPSRGDEKSIAAISAQDLEGYRSRIFARDNLKVVIVGDITEVEVGALLDEVFGDLPEKADLRDIPQVKPTAGKRQVVEMNVPQSVAVFGMGSIKRKDPEFMAAFVLNHIIGGGGFASKLMEEVREKRGLAYSVYSYINPFRSSSVMLGSVATKNEAIGKSLEVIREELKKMAENGPTQEELDNAKDYLIGSYPLRFDTNAKIANQLLGILVEDMGIDYIDKRNDLVRAVTLDDVKRVATNLLKPENLLVTIVGKPQGL